MTVQWKSYKTQSESSAYRDGTISNHVPPQCPVSLQSQSSFLSSADPSVQFAEEPVVDMEVRYSTDGQLLPNCRSPTLLSMWHSCVMLNYLGERGPFNSVKTVDKMVFNAIELPTLDKFLLEIIKKN